MYAVMTVTLVLMILWQLGALIYYWSKRDWSAFKALSVILSMGIDKVGLQTILAVIVVSINIWMALAFAGLGWVPFWLAVVYTVVGGMACLSDTFMWFWATFPSIHPQYSTGGYVYNSSMR